MAIDRSVLAALSSMPLVIALACAAAASGAPRAEVFATPACLNQASVPTVVHHSRFVRRSFRSRMNSIVKVDLGHDGIVHAVKLVSTSGDKPFDAAAIAAARSTAFAPASHGCAAIDSTFDETFTTTSGSDVLAKLSAAPVTAKLTR